MGLSDSLQHLGPIPSGVPLEEVLTATRLNAIQDAIRSLANAENINFGEGVRKTSGAGYVSYQFEPAEDFSRADSSSGHPWRVSLEEDKLVMLPGTVNLILPSNIFEKKAKVSDKGSNYVNLKVLTDGKSVSSLTWEVVAAAPTPTESKEGTAPASFTIPVAVVLETTIYQIEVDNLSFNPVNSMVVPRAPKFIGDERVTRWWNWVRT